MNALEKFIKLCWILLFWFLHARGLWRGCILVTDRLLTPQRNNVVNHQHLRYEKVRTRGWYNGACYGKRWLWEGKPGTADKKPTSLDQILAISAFISVWIALGLWQDLSLSSRVIIPSGLSLALTSDFHINMYNIIEIIEVTFAESVYYKFLPLYSFHQDESCW